MFYLDSPRKVYLKIVFSQCHICSSIFFSQYYLLHFVISLIIGVNCKHSGGIFTSGGLFCFRDTNFYKKLHDHLMGNKKSTDLSQFYIPRQRYRWLINSFQKKPKSLWNWEIVVHSLMDSCQHVPIRTLKKTLIVCLVQSIRSNYRLGRSLLEVK